MKKSDVRFDSEFEEEGTWWLPEHQDNKVSGKLSYSIANGIKLKIRYANNFFNEPYGDDPEIINGILTCGLQVSLLKCLKIHDDNQINFSPNYRKQTTQIFHIPEAFFGKHFNEKEISELNFKKMKLHFTFIDWFRDHGEEFNQMNINNSDNLKCTYQYAIEIKNIKTKILYSQTLKAPNGENITHNNKSSLSIIPETKASFDWFLTAASDLANFLSLVSDMRNQYNQVLFYINDNDYVSFLHQLSFPVDKQELNNIRAKMIQFAPIKDKFADILQSWFKKSNELRSVFDLFFSVVMHPKLYEQSKFIHLTQALEIFYKPQKISPLVPLSKKEFKKSKNILKKAIQDLNVNEKFKHFASEKLKYWRNSPNLSLQKKLKKIISPMEQKLKEQLIHPFKEKNKRDDDKEKRGNIAENEEKFLRDIRVIRNKLTHSNTYNDTLSKRKALSYYTKKLFILLSYLILIEVGFPKDLVSKNFRNELTL